MSNLKKLFYNCKAAQEQGLKLQAKQKITLRSWLAMKFHLVFCRYCRWFLKQSRLIDKALSSHQQQLLDNLQTKLSPAEKEALQQQINQQNR